MKKIIIKIFLFFISLKSSPIFGQMYSLDDLSKLGVSHICENKVYQSIDDAILLGKIWDMKEGKLVNDRYVSNRVADINKDGIKEILMQRESGGNCCAPELSIIIFDKNCKISKLNFPKWNWIWGGWDDIVFQLSNNKVDLIALNDHQGIGVNELNQQKVTYRYDGGSISFVSLYETIQIEALVNLKSSFFSSDLIQEDQYIDFDLNGDQIKEEISCNYWYRWGSMTDCKVIIQDGTNILDVNRSTFHPKRLGILSEKKNGWNVLVVDYNKRLIYDPEKKVYEEIKQN